MTPRLLVALTLALLVIALPAAAGQAAFPGDNGRILFTSQPDNSEGLFTTSPDGIDVQPLVTTEGDEQGGAWSPDGRRVAFASRRGPENQYRIFVREADGTERQVTFAPAFANHGEPAWSPDGTRIAFTSSATQTPFDSQIHVASADGTGTPVALTEEGWSYNAAWSPDGRTIAFETNRDEISQIYAMDADGRNERRLTDLQRFSYDPAWAPDGGQIVFTVGGETGDSLWTMTPAGGDQSPIPGDVAGREPAFSPDGTRIAFSRFVSGSGASIWTMGRDGGDQRRVTPSDGPNAVEPDWQPVPRPDPTVTPTPTPTATPTPPPPPPPPPPTLPEPVAGKLVNGSPISGTVLVRLPGTKRYVRISAGRQLPVGTSVDTRKGRIEIEVPDGAGKTAKAEFFDGIFKLSQPKGARPLTTLTLSQKLTCPTGRKATTSATRKRRLWGSGKGRFRTKGRYSAATVRGTKWLVEDTCNGTLTSVTQGSVSVRDFVKRKTIVVRKGKRYVARARR